MQERNGGLSHRPCCPSAPPYDQALDGRHIDQSTPSNGVTDGIRNKPSGAPQNATVWPCTSILQEHCASHGIESHVPYWRRSRIHSSAGTQPAFPQSVGNSPIRHTAASPISATTHVKAQRESCYSQTGQWSSPSLSWSWSCSFASSFASDAR